MVIKAFLVTLFISISFPLFARDLTDLQIEITTPLTGAEARQEALERATEKATMQLAEQFVGAERLGKVWPQISGRVLKNSSRYVLFIKGSPPEESPEGTKIQVQLRLSPDNLESLLREAGAMVSSTVRLLPLIQLVDARGSKYFWWVDTSSGKTLSETQELFKGLMKGLATQLKGKNVFILDPSSPSFRASIPVNYRIEELRREDQALLAQYLKADVVLSGKVAMAKPKADGQEVRVEYGLQLWQSKTGRTIAENEVSDTSSGELAAKSPSSFLEKSSTKGFSDLAYKLNEAIASGNLNLNVVRLAIQGPLNYKQQTEFKRLLQNVRDIRNLKERLFEPSRVTFEAETSVTGQELARLVEKSSFPQFKVEVGGAQDNSLVLSVRPLSSAQ